MTPDPTEVEVRVDVFIDRFGIEPSWRNALLALVRQEREDARREAIEECVTQCERQCGWAPARCIRARLAAPQRAEDRGE